MGSTFSQPMRHWRLKRKNLDLRKCIFSSRTLICVNSFNSQFINLFSQHVTAPAMASVTAVLTEVAAVSVKRGGRVNTANQKSVRAGFTTWKTVLNVLDY